MSFLKSLFRLDADSHLAQGDAHADKQEWGLAHMEYERALMSWDDDARCARDDLEAKVKEAAEKTFDANREKAARARESGELDEALAFLQSAAEVLDEGDERRAGIREEIQDVERTLDEQSLNAEIEAFLKDQGTAELVQRRRQWEFSLYLVHPSDVDLDDSPNYTTLELIELAAAVEESPDDPERLISLGLALARTGYIRRAIAPLRRATELKPDDREAHYLLGNVLADEGHFDLAIASFGRALEQDPDFALAYLYLGRTYLAIDNDAQAEPILVQAVEHAPGDSGIAEEALDLLTELRARRKAEPDYPSTLPNPEE